MMSAPRRTTPQPFRPPRSTVADWLALGVGPVLIMVMVGSLVFFLAHVGYRGSFSGQLYWTLSWFVMASVLVSRISIENGSALGSVYGLALGAATAFRMVGFLGAPWGALLLLGVIWWCASKLTWDCTVIDDDEDASGEGLLRHAGFEERTGEAAESPPAKPEAVGWDGRVRRAHAPGVWVIRVALGALPIFGVGQWLLPVADTEARLWGFILAVLFIASALSLLLTSSFLGLRRYLRQRHLQMPASMARAWMSWGALMAGGVLLLALVLPRPRGLETLAGLGWGLGDRPQTASSKAWMRGQSAPGEGRRIGTRGDPAGSQAEGAQPGKSGQGIADRDPQAGAGKETGKNGTVDPSTEAGADPDSGASVGGGDGDSGKEGDSGSRSGRGGRAAASRPPLEPMALAGGGAWMALLRAVSWLLGVGFLVFLLLRFGRGWWAALRRAWPERQRGVPHTGPAEPRVRRFPAYADPFTSGRAESMQPAELVVYTFEALEAWAADAGRERRPEETPMEFGEALSRRSPESAEAVRGAVRLYAGVAYGGRVPPLEDVALLRRLWSVLR